jgi:hypothetical protein
VFFCVFFSAEEGKKRQQQPLITSCAKFWVPFLQRFVNSSFLFFCYLAEGKKSKLCLLSNSNITRRKKNRSLDQERVTTINQWDFVGMQHCLVESLNKHHSPS